MLYMFVPTAQSAFVKYDRQRDPVKAGDERAAPVDERGKRSDDDVASAPESAISSAAYIQRSQ